MARQNSPWRAVGDFCGLEKEVFILTPVSAVPNFTHSLLKEERTMSTSPMMMIVWQKSSPLSSRASTAIASSVLSLLSGTAFKMISDVIFRSQKRARASLAS